MLLSVDYRNFRWTFNHVSFLLEESLLDRGCVSSPTVLQREEELKYLGMGLPWGAPPLPSEMACPKMSHHLAPESFWQADGLHLRAAKWASPPVIRPSKDWALGHKGQAKLPHWQLWFGLPGGSCPVCPVSWVLGSTQVNTD